MRTTTYYNLNIVEGTDIVNPLTVDNPNYETIDEVMHDNAVSGVTLATEIANATVHAISRENSECAVIRFIATSEWKAGDTVTVDGVPVTALLPSGETLPDGAYVINANVLCILTGTYLTIYAERKKTDNANEIAYNETTVDAELTALNSNLSTKAQKRDYVTSVVGTEKVNLDTSAYKVECIVIPYPDAGTKTAVPITIDLGILSYAVGSGTYNVSYGGNSDYHFELTVTVTDYTKNISLKSVKWSNADLTSTAKLVVATVS